MITAINNFSAEQKRIAVRRLTALWAFSESGLGGMLHALQVPFTGLIVGGMAVILITLIAFFSQQNIKSILRSMLIVLIIKAVVSPHSPFPAYIAVSFQAVTGFLLFYLLRINLVSIILLSVIAMMESAIQKLLILTLFFGQSFWDAIDRLSEFIAVQFNLNTINGSNLLIGIYLMIYFLGGIGIAWMAYKIIKDIFVKKELLVFDASIQPAIQLKNNKKRKGKLLKLTILLIIISILLFLFAPDANKGWLAVIKTVTWTFTAILLWYFVISPLVTKFIQQLLKKKESRYHEEVAEAIAFLPLFKQITYIAWQKSRQYRGWKRLQYFFSGIVYWSITSHEAGHSLNENI